MSQRGGVKLMVCAQEPWQNEWYNLFDTTNFFWGVGRAEKAPLHVTLQQNVTTRRSELPTVAIFGAQIVLAWLAALAK